METHLHTWLSLLLRWAHVVAGVAWIGATFYFNWLENRMRRLQRPGSDPGGLRDAHGGGFAYLSRLDIAPDQLPAQLGWIKHSAYTSWITGILMLVVVYYWQAGVYMVDAGVADISAQLAVISGLATLILSWLFYDLLCRSAIARSGLLLGGLVIAWFGAVTWVLTQLLSGHAAYLHVGAAAGTIMVANVFHIIAPLQRELAKPAVDGHGLDPAKAGMALQRSRHNSYFALPVLFVMISGHYPVMYGHGLNWLALLLIVLFAVSVRHWFDTGQKPGERAGVAAAAPLLLVGLIYVTVPAPRAPEAVEGYGSPWLQNVRTVIQDRCQQCHSTMPQVAEFASAPLGIELDSQEEVLKYADRLYEMTVISKTMPPDNSTHMTAEERQTIAEWYALVQHFRLLQKDPGE